MMQLPVEHFQGTYRSMNSLGSFCMSRPGLLTRPAEEQKTFLFYFVERGERESACTCKKKHKIRWVGKGDGKDLGRVRRGPRI